MNTYGSSWILLLVILVQCPKAGGQSRSLEYSRLRSEILNRSVVVNKVPPNWSTDYWTNWSTDFWNDTLWIFITVVDILSIDQTEQVLHSLVQVQINWRNTELQWSPYDYGGLFDMELDSTAVWVPRILVNVGAHDSLYLTMVDTLKLGWNGVTVSDKYQYLSFRCRFDLTRYPFDLQHCGFGLLPMNVPPSNMALVKFVLNDSHIYNLFGEWTLVNRSAEMVVPSLQNLLPKVTFTFKRKPAYHVIFLVFPLVLTSMLTPLVFLIPARTGEKMSYLVAIFTSTAIFITLISDAMPRGLSSTPYLAMLLIEVMVEGVCAILASLLVSNLYEREESMNKSCVSSHSELANDVKCKSGCNKQTVEESFAQKSSFPCRGIPIRSRDLDMLFLALFGLGQLIFLFVLFCLTDWLGDV